MSLAQPSLHLQRFKPYRQLSAGCAPRTNQQGLAWHIIGAYDAPCGKASYGALTLIGSAIVGCAPRTNQQGLARLINGAYDAPYGKASCGALRHIVRPERPMAN